MFAIMGAVVWANVLYIAVGLVRVTSYWLVGVIRTGLCVDLGWVG